MINRQMSCLCIVVVAIKMRNIRTASLKRRQFFDAVGGRGLDAVGGPQRRYRTAMMPRHARTELYARPPTATDLLQSIQDSLGHARASRGI